MSFYIKGKGWFESGGQYMGSKRKMALACARRCGFEGDSKTYTRLLIEARVSKAALDEQWRIGAAIREAQGVVK